MYSQIQMKEERASTSENIENSNEKEDGMGVDLDCLSELGVEGDDADAVKPLREAVPREHTRTRTPLLLLNVLHLTSCYRASLRGLTARAQVLKCCRTLISF